MGWTGNAHDVQIIWAGDDVHSFSVHSYWSHQSEGRFDIRLITIEPISEVVIHPIHDLTPFINLSETDTLTVGTRIRV